MMRNALLFLFPHDSVYFESKFSMDDYFTVATNKIDFLLLNYNGIRNAFNRIELFFDSTRSDLNLYAYGGLIFVLVAFHLSCTEL